MGLPIDRSVGKLGIRSAAKDDERVSPLFLFLLPESRLDLIQLLQQIFEILNRNQVEISAKLLQ